MFVFFTGFFVRLAELLFQLDQDLVFVHKIPGFDVDGLDLARNGGLHGVLHFHGLDDAAF